MTDVAKVLTLEERITQKIHENIGDLVTPEDLKAMIARGVEAALFEPRNVITSRGYGAAYQEQRPSVIEEQVTKFLLEQVRDAVDAWIKANPEKIEATLTRVFQDGIAEALTQSLERKFVGVIPFAIQNMQNNGLLPR